MKNIDWALLALIGVGVLGVIFLFYIATLLERIADRIEKLEDKFSIVIARNRPDSD